MPRERVKFPRTIEPEADRTLRLSILKAVGRYPGISDAMLVQVISVRGDFRSHKISIINEIDRMVSDGLLVADDGHKRHHIKSSKVIKFRSFKLPG